MRQSIKKLIEELSVSDPDDTEDLEQKKQEPSHLEGGLTPRGREREDLTDYILRDSGGSEDLSHPADLAAKYGPRRKRR